MDVSNDSMVLADTTTDNIKAGHISKVETPWRYWRWLIVIYQSSAVLSMTILFNFFITELSGDEVLIYTGSEGKIQWDLVSTIPFVMLMIEYPFNQIPISWGMVFFNLALVNFYLFVNFIIVTFTPEHDFIYEDFDWYDNPARALVSYLVLMAFTITLFGLFWALTMKLKLPAYRERDEKKLSRLDFQSTQGNPYTSIITSSPTTLNYKTSMKKAEEHDSSRMTNLSAESNPLREGDGKMSAA